MKLTNSSKREGNQFIYILHKTTFKHCIMVQHTQVLKTTLKFSLNSLKFWIAKIFVKITISLTKLGRKQYLVSKFAIVINGKLRKNIYYDMSVASKDNLSAKLNFISLQ